MIDADISKTFQAIMEKQGLCFQLSSKVTSAEINKDGGTLHVETKGKTSTYEGEVVLCCIGRRPYTKSLGLDRVGITPNSKGFISINGHFQTCVESIYAIGDIVDGPMLAHKASEEGVAVAEIIAGQAPHIEYTAIPNVIYTHPEVASVGLTEEQAKEHFTVRTGSSTYKANSRAKCKGDEEGKVKVVADRRSDTILGIHIVGSHASEIIAEGVLAIKNKVKALDLANTAHAHPTLSEAVKEAALDVHGRPIHF
jgi:dihydrolipoamide dehydrogenase